MEEKDLPAAEAAEQPETPVTEELSEQPEAEAPTPEEPEPEQGAEQSPAAVEPEQPEADAATPETSEAEAVTEESPAAVEPEQSESDGAEPETSEAEAVVEEPPSAVEPEQPETDAVEPGTLEAEAVAEEPSAAAEPEVFETEAVAEEPEVPVEVDEASDELPPEIQESFSAEQLLGDQEQPAPASDSQAAELKAVLEAIVYVLNEPMPAAQIAAALDRPLEEVEPVLRLLAEETSRAERGIFIREVAGGYQMATKPEHHEVLRSFVKNLKQPLKLSQAALETLAVIAYKQPITMPEILEIRGVQGGGVIKTLLDRKIITTAGRKNVIGKPILYKTTKEFLTQFGLKDLNELPSLKEFEDIRRQSLADEEIGNPEQPNLPEQPEEPVVESPKEEAPPDENNG